MERQNYRQNVIFIDEIPLKLLSVSLPPFGTWSDELIIHDYTQWK